jgi:hypothetical protein
VALSLKLARQLEVMENTIRCLEDVHVSGKRFFLPMEKAWL